MDNVDHSIRPVREEVRGVRNLDVIDDSRKERRSKARPVKRSSTWTEITKDLVSEAAIKAAGYVFEETENAFHVMEYLRYVSINLSSHFYLSCHSNLALCYRRMFFALPNLPKIPNISDGGKNPCVRLA